MKYCLGVTHLAISGIRPKLRALICHVNEKETAMELKLASETEIKKYFQMINCKRSFLFNDIVIAIYQLYEYLQTKTDIPFGYEYYLKKEIHCHNNRKQLEMEIYEKNIEN